jgi:hypothetical protein
LFRALLRGFRARCFVLCCGAVVRETRAVHSKLGALRDRE